MPITFLCVFEEFIIISACTGVCVCVCVRTRCCHRLTAIDRSEMLLVAPPSPAPPSLIISTEMLSAVTAAEFTPPSAVFAYCLIWIFPIETVPQQLMASVFHGCYSPSAISPITTQRTDKSNGVNSSPPDWLHHLLCISSRHTVLLVFNAGE